MRNPDTGKRVARVSPPEEWIVAQVPELRIPDDALGHAAKARQREPAERYATAFAATRNACASRVNVVHRLRYLFSGPLRLRQLRHDGLVPTEGRSDAPSSRSGC